MKCEQLEDRNLLTCYSFGAEYDVFPVEGTNGPDTIEVSDDFAIINGTRHEIDECYDKVSIYGKDGNDTIRVSTDRFESVHIDAGQGDNAIHFTGEADHLNLYAGRGDDTVTVVNAEVEFARLNTGDEGQDSVKVLSSWFSTLTCGFIRNPTTIIVIGCDIGHFISKTSVPWHTVGYTLAMIDTDVRAIATVQGGHGVDLFGFMDCEMKELRLTTNGSADIIVAVNHQGNVDRDYDQADIVHEIA